MIDAISIGQLANDIVQPLSRVRVAVKKLNIKPVLRLNGVDHYSRGDVDRIDAFIKAGDTNLQPANAQ